MERKVLQLRLSKKAQFSCLSLAACMGMAMLLQPTNAHAIAGACVSCHTMHNSQNALPMATDALGNPDTTANDQLLLGADCLACHTGTNEFVGGTDTTPFVTDVGAGPTYGVGDGGTLAGGSFYYTIASDAAGHNVVGVAGLDTAAGTATGLVPPGGLTLASQLTCAGTTGCHGVRTTAGDMAAINGSHHANVNGSLYGGTVVDSGSSYRFLDGVQGFEDPDYEATAVRATTDHNGYYGVDRADDAIATVDVTTVSALCAQCHSAFHNDAGTTSLADPGIQGSGVVMTSPWIRHPTDFDMSNAANVEYAGYADYEIDAPVGNSTAFATQNLILGAGIAGQERVVICMSCHRAHGSPYDDALRWDYTEMTVGNAGAGAGTGCFQCHTAKDGI